MARFDVSALCHLAHRQERERERERVSTQPSEPRFQALAGFKTKKTAEETAEMSEETCWETCSPSHAKNGTSEKA